MIGNRVNVTMRRHSWVVTIATAMCGLMAGPACTRPDGLDHEVQGSADAMAQLRQGNDRFVSGRPNHPHLDRLRRIETMREGQHPYAVIVGCADSRVPVEHVLDAGIGDLFVIRVAGNVCAGEEIGSIEYGVEHLHTPIVVILGHRGCGAVTAACKHSEEHGHIPDLLSKIEPAVERVLSNSPDLSEAALVDEVVRANVEQSIQSLIAESEIVRDALSKGETQVVGGVYDPSTGRIEWLESSTDDQQSAMVN